MRCHEIAVVILLATASLAAPGAAQTAPWPGPEWPGGSLPVLPLRGAFTGPWKGPDPAGARTLPPLRKGSGPPALRRQAPPDHWLASDKLKHFFLSFGVTGFAFAGARLVGAGDAADWLAPGTAAVAGLGKEVSDHRRAWGFSLRDLAWDAAGIAAAMAVLRETR